MTAAEKNVKERDKIIALQQDMIAHYERDLFPKYRERAEKALCVRDEALAHNAVLRQALEAIRKEHPLKRCMAEIALNTTPPDSAAKVQGLVSALESMVDVIDDQLGGGGYVPEFGVDIDEKLEPWASIFDAQEKAQKALAEWRKWHGRTV